MAKFIVSVEREDGESEGLYGMADLIRTALIAAGAKVLDTEVMQSCIDIVVEHGE